MIIIVPLYWVIIALSAIAYLWIAFGLSGFFYWWSNEFHLTNKEIPMIIVASALGVFSWFFGQIIRKL